MTDSDQPNSTRRFDLQLDEWLGTHLLGPQASGYPGDTDFERMARAIESAVLAHDAAAPLRTPVHVESELMGSAHGLAGAHAADESADLDWCLAAPLPLRSGEPLNWGSEPGDARGAEQRGSQTTGRDPAEQGIGTQGRLRGAQAVAGAGPDEPSLQELAEAMLANGREPQRKADREHSSAERSGVDIAGADRISEVKPLKGARPAAKPPLPPRVGGPISVVHLARQGVTESRMETQELGSSDEAHASASLEHRANAVSEAPRPRDEAVLRDEASVRKLNWLWGAMALAAAVTLGVQFGKHSDNTAAQDNAVAMGNAAASQQLVIAQPALPQPASLAPQSMASAAAAKAEGSEAVAVADLAALPRDGEGAESARARAARPAVGNAESGAGSRHAAGSRPSGAKPGEAVVESPPATESRSLGALASRDEAPRTETSASAGSESEPALRPAARSTSGLPPEPSVGAATGAIGVVLPGARACVAGQFEPSRANVVFGSDGRVIRVEVSGPAAGTPAEACIARVLKAARVGAFSSESFSVRTTVRP